MKKIIKLTKYLLRYETMKRFGYWKWWVW